MNRVLLTLTFLCLIPLLNTANHQKSEQKPWKDYHEVLRKYLNSRRVKPSIVIENITQNKLSVGDHMVKWNKKEDGISFTIDEKQFTTTNKLTVNNVWGNKKDELNIANSIERIKLYEQDSIITIELRVFPCTGLACGLSYHLIYDLRTGAESYFGCFRNGIDFELYNFNNDGRIDYVSRTYYGRNMQGIDTTKYVLFSRMQNGQFKKLISKAHKFYWFQHVYGEYGEKEIRQHFSEQWMERIER